MDPLYPDSMFTFTEASHKLGIPMAEIFELLGLSSIEEAEAEDLTVDEIIEACFDCGLYYDDDASDSIANHCESYPYN